MMAAMATADKERENGGGGEKRSAGEDDLKDDEKAKKQLKTVEPKSPSDESKTKTKSAERLLKEGFVPISEKYLVLADDAAAKEPVSASNGSSAPAVCPTVSTSKKPSGHNRSGKSKNRLKKERRERIESKALLCHAFARGDCPFGDKCRWNHDVEAFLSQKEEDLPGKVSSLVFSLSLLISSSSQPLHLELRTWEITFVSYNPLCHLSVFVHGDSRKLQVWCHLPLLW